MSVTLQVNPDDKVIELGGGANPSFHPNVDVRQCFDAEGRPTVDFTADFNEPLPIQSNEWDVVFSQFVIEHLSWRRVPQFIAEVFRILKPGGRTVTVTANTHAQVRWILRKGWEARANRRGEFEEASCILFGDNDYPENTHRSYFTPPLAKTLFEEAGFQDVEIRSYGDIQTDMVIQATKPAAVAQMPQEHRASNPEVGSVPAEVQGGMGSLASTPPLPPPEILFGRDYFDGGKLYGGFGPPYGYWDFPCHEITARHILSRRPESVLELGCARGYILKRVQDAGIYGCGLEVSKHTHMTRVCDNLWLWDVCKIEWPMPANREVDLCYSIAVLDHLPEPSLPGVIREMARTCRRGFHGINFGPLGGDRTRQTIRPREWWLEQFHHYAGGWPVEIVDKDELERGDFPQDVLRGDGKVKLNLGSFTTMFYHGWENIDLHDLGQFAQANGYKYRRHDIRQGLPYPTSSVDLIYSSHCLEHLTYEEGLRLLKECRRVIKADGALRLIVPHAGYLTNLAVRGEAAGLTLLESMSPFDEINEGCAKAKTPMAKLYSVLYAGGHLAAYDETTLTQALEEAGFAHRVCSFRQGKQTILRETLDVLPCLSLYVEGAVDTN